MGSRRRMGHARYMKATRLHRVCGVLHFWVGLLRTTKSVIAFKRKRARLARKVSTELGLPSIVPSKQCRLVRLAPDHFSQSQELSEIVLVSSTTYSQPPIPPTRPNAK